MEKIKKEKSFKSKKTNIFVEEAIDLIVNGKRLLTFMCTPENIEDLAMGYLYSKGLIDSKDEYMGSSTCESGKRFFVLLDKKLPEEAFNIRGVVLSGCGSGELPKGETFVRNKTPNHTEKISKIKESFFRVLNEAELHKTKGGTHSAGILNENGDLIVREDIGRHNAVDKVIGAGLKENFDLTKCTIIITGRVSSDMTLTALGAGIPIIASMRITSNLAIEIASTNGTVILGRMASPEPIVYNSIESINILQD